MPSQLKQKIPWFSYCEGPLFTAFDPPSALKAATALAPPLSPPLSNDPISHPWAPVPSPTIDPEAGHTVGAETSTPVPAKIPTVDQPEATNTADLIPPKQEGPNPEPQSNDPATQESPSSQSRPNKVGPSSNTIEDNDPQQSSDPHQGSSPEQGSGSSGDSGQEADPKPNSDSSQVDSNQGSTQNPESIPQDGPKQTDDANPFNGFTEGQVQTTNNQIIQPLSHGISIAGTTFTPGAPPVIVSDTSTVPLVSGDPSLVTTIIGGHVITAAPDVIAIAGITLTRGAPPITLSGTPIHFGSSALVVGISTISLAPEFPTQITTKTAGQAIADHTLNPGAPATTIDGTILSLNTAGQFVVGSQTIPFGSKVPDTMTINIAGQNIAAAPSLSNAVTVAGTTLTPGAPGITLDGTLLSLDTASELIVGSKTVPLGSASPNSTVTAIGGQVVTAAPDRVAIGGTALTPGASGITVGGTLVSHNTAQGNNFSTGGGNGTITTSVKAFQGNAASLKGYFLCNSMAVAAVAMCVILMCLC